MKEGAMSEKEKKEKKSTSRRGFLKAAAVAGGAASTIGFPAVMRVSAQQPIKIKMQTAWDAGTIGFEEFKKFCKLVGSLARGSSSWRASPQAP
jgi:hypothetical protein